MKHEHISLLINVGLLVSWLHIYQLNYCSCLKSMINCSVFSIYVSGI